MTWRKLRALLRNMPPDQSVLYRQLQPELAWSTTDYLLAGVWDSVQGGNWQRGGGKGRRPDPIPRPTAPRRMTEADERARRFFAWRKAKGATRGD